MPARQRSQWNHKLEPDPLVYMGSKNERHNSSANPNSLRHVLALGRWPTRFLVAAALLHITLVVGLNLAGRAQLAPGLIDRDGIMSSFALDSYTYQRSAIGLSTILKEQGLSAWVAEGGPVHISLFSLQFALFGGLFGYSPLSIELLNLFCYVVTLWLVFAIGRELAGERVALIGAGAVALFPSLLLHSTQLLKEPLFVTGGLAFILISTTTLTRTYTRGTAAIVSVLGVIPAMVLLRIRFQLGLLLLAAVGFGLVLLVIRQLLERRLLFWNLVCPLLVLTAGALAPLYMARTVEKFKQHPPVQIGESKRLSSVRQIPAIVNYANPSGEKMTAASNSENRISAIVNWAALELYATRHNYNVDVLDAGSAVDQEIGFRTIKDVVNYLPRAFELGMWAPFPNTWARTGKYVGKTGMILAAAETTVIYLCQLLALVAVICGERRLASALLLAFSVFGVTMLGLVVSNVGTLYRLRYIFWILLIVLAAKGLYEIALLAGKRNSNWLSKLR